MDDGLLQEPRRIREVLLPAMVVQQFADPVLQLPVGQHHQDIVQPPDLLLPEAPPEQQRAVAEAPHPLRIDRFIQDQAAPPVHRAVLPILELLIQPVAPEALLPHTADPTAAVHLPADLVVAVVPHIADPAAVVHLPADQAVAVVVRPIADPAAAVHLVAPPIADQVVQALHLIAADVHLRDHLRVDHLRVDHLRVHVLPQEAAVQVRAEDKGSKVPLTI